MTKSSSKTFNPWLFHFKSRHDPDRKLPGFETELLSDVWKAQRAHDLKRLGEAALAEKLYSCRDGQRCLSDACPVCKRQFRRWFAIAVCRLQRKLNIATQGCVISLVPDQPEIPLKELRTFNLRPTEYRVRRALMKTSLLGEPIIGGWDFSVNEDSKGAFAPFVKPHFYFIGLTISNPEKLHRELRSLFPQTEHTKRPVSIAKFASKEAQATYAVKDVFERRIRYFDEAKGKHDTRHLPLRPHQEVELLVFLDRLGMTRRLFLLNVRRRGYRLDLEPRALAAIRDRRQKHSGTLE